MPKILVVYYSRHGGVARMAEEIGLGVESSADCEAVLRCLPAVSTAIEQ
ncbi:MAG: NAD(P)H-quinone oxidoreductase, partial [Gammaproteobacteria bacterium]|nr:NAD(P)H-quinone oxidoreductase [Gammaproteobacteria bacterium]